jgi:hypothetical protein
MHETRPIPRHSSRFQRWYVTLWAYLAAVAVGYMTLLFVAPDWITTSIRVEAQSQPEATPEEPITAERTEEGDVLRDSVAELEAGAEQPEAGPAAFGEQDPTAPVRVASAEPSITAPAPPAAVEPVGAPPPASSAEPAPTPVAIEAPSPVALEFPTTTGPKIVIVNGAEASSITTSSLPAPPPPPSPIGPATVAPAPGRVGIHLGSASSLDALHHNWSLLSEQHQSVLQNLEPRYDAVGAGAALRYELIAGPFAGPAEARRVCALLRVKKVACGVGPFVGEAL